MTHLDEGRLRALLDDELGDVEGATRTHMKGCRECSDSLALIEACRSAAQSAIAILDVQPPLVEAREAVMARVRSAASEPGQAESSHARAWAGIRLTLRRAAVIVLLLTGLSAALPGSAVRAWMLSGWRAAVEFFDDDHAPSTPESASAVQEPGAAGVQFEITGAPLHIVLSLIESGSLVVVRFVDGNQATFSGADAGFRRTADGRLEVMGGSGTIHIDIPRAVSSASLRVNERIYLTMNGDAVDVTGPIEAQTPEEISFRVR